MVEANTDESQEKILQFQQWLNSRKRSHCKRSQPLAINRLLTSCKVVKRFGNKKFGYKTSHKIEFSAEWMSVCLTGWQFEMFEGILFAAIWSNLALCSTHR